MRTIPSINEHLQCLDDVVNNYIAVLLRSHHFTELERDLFALPANLGWLISIKEMHSDPDNYISLKLDSGYYDILDFHKIKH